MSREIIQAFPNHLNKPTLFPTKDVISELDDIYNSEKVDDISRITSFYILQLVNLKWTKKRVSHTKLMDRQIMMCNWETSPSTRSESESLS